MGITATMSGPSGFRAKVNGPGKTKTAIISQVNLLANGNTKRVCNIF